MVNGTSSCGGRRRGRCVVTTRRRHGTVGRAGQCGGECAGGSRNRKDGRLGGNARVGKHVRCVGIEHVPYNVHDAVGEQNVGLDDLGRVCVLVVSTLMDRQLQVVEAGCVLGEGGVFGSVGERLGVEDLVGDDVVVHDPGQLGGIEALKGATDGLECLV